MKRIHAALIAGSGAIRNARAEQVVTQLEAELSARKIELDNEKRAIRAEKAVLMDMGPDQTTSLRVTSPDFSPKGYVIKLNSLNKRLIALEDEAKALAQTIDDILGEVPDVALAAQAMTTETIAE